MVRGRHRDSGPPQEEASASARPLEFDEPITWRSGRPIAIADLLRRLKALSEELIAIDQDDAHRESLVPKAQELAHTQLLDHRDKGVKAYVMVCIVEMFRLLAPDAPYKGGQLKQIFSFFINSILPALANPSDPYSQLHISVLVSLNTVKSIVLLADIPGSDSLVLALFTNCFDVVSGGSKNANVERLPKNLEHHMTGMLCTLIDEMTGLPNGVIEIILAQFLRADPNVVLSGSKKNDTQLSEVLPEPSAAYNMARAICNTCADKIVHANAHYFSSVLIDASQVVEGPLSGRFKGRKRTNDDSEDENERGLLTPPAEDDLYEAEKAHRLLRELWRATPEITRNVIPQMEAELRTENVRLRNMAVHTVGDMVAGIGAAGPPPPFNMDPAAYPSQSLELDLGLPQQHNILLQPSAPIAFSTAYPAAYQSLIDRHKDKSWQVRATFATVAGRIVLTSAGGKGLSTSQQEQLLQSLSDLLNDMDDRVRLAGVEVIATFDYHSIVQKLGSHGGVSTSGSILHSLADRIKDRKPAVRTAAIEFLGRLWGVAYGAIAEGDTRTRDLLGAIPSKILDAMYLNDPVVTALVQRVLYEFLLPLSFPPKNKIAGVGNSQSVRDSQETGNNAFDADAIRARRILVLVRDLEEERAKKVFFALQQRQPEIAKYMGAYLQACELSREESTTATTKQLDGLITYFSQTFSPDPPLMTEHLRKFAKCRDLRSYQLIRFCCAPESDFRKVYLAMKELKKRLTETLAGMAGAADTLIPLVRQASILIYNRSHVPAIVEISRTDADGLGSAAHALLRDISSRVPEIFKIHVSELCETLKKQSPQTTAPADPNIVDTLKACASFARRFPKGMPKDREFYKAMIAFAARGQPPKCAKHAVTVIVKSAEKQEMYIKEIEDICIKKFEYGAEGFLSKLAAMSQLRLVANHETEDLSDQMMSIAIDQVLTQARTAAKPTDPEWTDDMDEDVSAKLWALRILINGLRGRQSNKDEDGASERIISLAAPIYRLLNTLIDCEGELGQEPCTPKHHRARLRLAAATQLLKLSCNPAYDHLLTPSDFNRLAMIAQDPTPEVRVGFFNVLKKYLGAGILPSRFYAIVFLYAFEPLKQTKDHVVNWIRARAAAHTRAQDTIMETTFARFLSLLAHHPDFSSDSEDLHDFVEYVLFYLRNVATQINLPMIYHIVQRLKSVQDAIDPEKSENIYIISDLAEAVIRHYQDLQEWSLQLFSGKVGLPTGIFGRLPSHSAAQEIAEKNYLPTDFAEQLQSIVQTSMKSKKRKPGNTSSHPAKKTKVSIDGVNTKKTTSAKARAIKPSTQRSHGSSPTSERRKSARVSRPQNYAEGDEDDDDEELQRWQDGAVSEAEKEKNALPLSPSPPPNDAHSLGSGESSTSPGPSPEPVTKAVKSRAKSKSEARGKAKAKAKTVDHRVQAPAIRTRPTRAVAAK